MYVIIEQIVEIFKNTGDIYDYRNFAFGDMLRIFETREQNNGTSVELTSLTAEK